MTQLFHSVLLIEEKCRGCTRCIRNCPTEAIRVRGGKARINVERCIDCGECIRTCDNHAKTAVTDPLSKLEEFDYTIALPAPSLYAQFGKETDRRKILASLIDMGFNDVFEVAYGADIATFLTLEYLKNPNCKFPAISAACPAVVRLIQVRFPSLIDHLIPVESPMACAGKLAKEKTSERLGIPEDKIGTFFITPCPAKVTWVREANSRGTFFVGGAISMFDAYGEIMKRLLTIPPPYPQLKASPDGVGWGRTGGERIASKIKNSLVVDGIHNVINVLEEVEMGRLDDVEFLEAQACVGGCIGGALTVLNPFIGKMNLESVVDKSKDRSEPPEDFVKEFRLKERLDEFIMKLDIMAVPAFRLDQDVSRAIIKAEMIEKVVNELPGLDCGSCGSPHCRALAEDIVQGLAVDTDCILKLREEIEILAEQLLEMAKKSPSALKRDDNSGESGE